VSSAVLTESAGLGVSSATIRNILAQLEEMGFVMQPHTSAGRVPTDLGYRFYVDVLLEARRAKNSVSAVEARLRQDAGEDPLVTDVLTSASHMLSETCHHVGFAVSPENAKAIFQRIEFVPLSGSRILVVVVTQNNDVTQKAVDIGEMVSPSELTQAANFLNSEFSGRPMDDVRQGVLARLREERTLYNQLLGLALRLASRSLENLEQPNAVCIDGTSSLLEQVVSASGLPVATLQALMGMVEEKQRLVRLLNAYIDGPGITVVIGAEHNEPELRAFSLIASTYSDGRNTGMVGVLGPTRMNYPQAMAAVAVVSQRLGRHLSR
jgi:heat-inducible transcriptional repressor